MLENTTDLTITVTDEKNQTFTLAPATPSKSPVIAQNPILSD